ncbi:MAG: YceI family protein, partial [Saprospiraceae bacterium]|nr:YceI family protein [Saprospiraceae bacterium]
DAVDFEKDGTYSVRAKGKLLIHGEEQERIIKSQMNISGNSIRVQSSFTVPLSDHNITIPKIVYQKIAEEIAVTVDAELKRN